MPLPVKLDSVPPVTETSAPVKSVDGSLSENVRCATSPMFSALSSVRTVRVGGVTSPLACANASPRPFGPPPPPERLLASVVPRALPDELPHASVVPGPEPDRDNAWAVSDHLELLIARRARVSFERAALLALLDGRGLHRELGFRSVHA